MKPKEVKEYLDRFVIEQAGRHMLAGTAWVLVW